LNVLDEASVPSGRIYTAEDIMNDEHYRARGMFQQVELPDGQQMTLPGIVPKLSATPGRTKWIGPTLGQHTQEVLDSIGVTPEQLARLRASGLV
jgi:formyl-CoA transferase